MSAEYTRLTHPEIIYGEKNFLQSQLELLNSIKSAEEYQKLRRRELRLKIELRRKLKNLRDNIKELDKKLPKIKEEPKKQTTEKPKIEKPEIKEPKTKKQTSKKKVKEKKKQKSELEMEIEDIKSKLESLQ